MAKLTPEMKALFETQLAIIATASKDGKPNAGPKGSMHVLDDETLAYGEGTGGVTMKNLKENPKAVVIIIDREKGNGYRFKGTARLETNGELFDRLTKRNESRKLPPPRAAVKIKVEDIFSVKSGMTDKKVG